MAKHSKKGKKGRPTIGGERFKSKEISGFNPENRFVTPETKKGKRGGRKMKRGKVRD